jgi:hypothetical protein
MEEEQVPKLLLKERITSLPTISRSADDFTRLEPSASGFFCGRNDHNSYSLNGAVFNNPFDYAATQDKLVRNPLMQ